MPLQRARVLDLNTLLAKRYLDFIGMHVSLPICFGVFGTEATAKEREQRDWAVDDVSVCMRLAAHASVPVCTLHMHVRARCQTFFQNAGSVGIRPAVPKPSPHCKSTSHELLRHVRTANRVT